MEFARLNRGEQTLPDTDNFVDALRKSISEMYGSGIPDIILEMTLLKLAAPAQTSVQNFAQVPNVATVRPTGSNLDAGKKIFYDVANTFGGGGDGIDALLDKAIVTDFSGDMMTLGFKSAPMATMFEKNHLEKFEQALEQATGHKIKVSLRVDKNFPAPILDRVNESDRTALAGALNAFGASDAKKI